MHPLRITLAQARKTKVVLVPSLGHSIRLDLRLSQIRTRLRLCRLGAPLGQCRQGCMRLVYDLVDVLANRVESKLCSGCSGH